MNYTNATAVSVTPTGDAVFTGSMQGTIDFGGGMLTSAGAGDLFVTKLDSAGSHIFSRHYGNMARTVGIAVAVDPTGNVVVG
jgi:hypothetical protein